MTGVPMDMGKTSETSGTSGIFPRELTSPTFLMFFPKAYHERHPFLRTPKGYQSNPDHPAWAILERNSPSLPALAR